MSRLSQGDRWVEAHGGSSMEGIHLSICQVSCQVSCYQFDISHRQCGIDMIDMISQLLLLGILKVLSFFHHFEL